MNRALILALALGLASAAYSNEASSRVVADFAGYYKLTYSYKFDWDYKTFYDAGISPDDKNLAFEKFSFNISSLAKVTFKNTFFDFYNYDIELSIIPFDVVPLFASLQYVRPEAFIFGTNFDMQFAFGYSFRALDFKLFSSHNMKGINKSFVDYFIDLAENKNSYTIYPASLAELVYADPANKYSDPIWYGNLSSLIKLIWPSADISWYGTGKYYYKIWLWGTRV
jgi:hypothetical protein